MNTQYRVPHRPPPTPPSPCRGRGKLWLASCFVLLTLAACDQVPTASDVPAPQPGERSVAVLPTTATPPSVEVDDLWREVARLLAREPGIRVIDPDIADGFRADADPVRTATALKARFVLTTTVTGAYRCDVLLRDGRTGAILWGKTIPSDHDNVGALAAEVWVAALAAIKAAKL